MSDLDSFEGKSFRDEVYKQLKCSNVRKYVKNIRVSMEKIYIYYTPPNGIQSLIPFNYFSHNSYFSFSVYLKNDLTVKIIFLKLSEKLIKLSINFLKNCVFLIQQKNVCIEYVVDNTYSDVNFIFSVRHLKNGKTHRVNEPAYTSYRWVEKDYVYKKIENTEFFKLLSVPLNKRLF